MNMVHQFGNQFKNQNGIQIQEVEKRKQKRKEKRRRPRSPGLLGFSARQRAIAPSARSRPAQLVCSSPASSPAHVAHVRMPPIFPCCRCHLTPHVSHPRLQCRLPHPRLNRLRDQCLTAVAGRARGHARGMALSFPCATPTQPHASYWMPLNMPPPLDRRPP